MIVLDACVATKLFVAERGSDDAARLVARHPLLLAPAIIAVEVTSAVTRKARNGELDRPAAERALAGWREFLQLGNLRLEPDGTLLAEAARRSLDLAHPVADCLYLALAAREGVPLVTADRPFYAAARGTRADVRLLNESDGGAA